jgi:hypothetical protein
VSAWADTRVLEPPAPAYPLLLDHACGGVHTSTYVLGFDGSGNIVGAVHAWTRCGIGSGRHRRSRNYSSWHKLVWDIHGTLLSTSVSEALSPDPHFTATDRLGNTISMRPLGSNWSSTSFVAVLTTP